MNPLSSLPPPSFVTGLAPVAPATAAASALLSAPADASPLHVGPPGVRSLDDLERDFVAALCETPDTPNRA